MRPEIEKGAETSGKSTGIRFRASKDTATLILKDDIWLGNLLKPAVEVDPQRFFCLFSILQKGIIRNMNYILLDESGDLGFKFNKGSSNFFIVTVVFTKSKRQLEKVVRGVHKGLSKKFKKVGILHAYKETPTTRKKILKRIYNIDCYILAIILNKRKVYTKFNEEKAVLYNYVTNILLDRLFTKKPIPSHEPIVLIASRRETNKFLNQNFKSYLQRKIINNHKLELQIEISNPSKEKSLQSVDFISWAIFRKYEINDESYYNIIVSKIIEEAPLFP